MKASRTVFRALAGFQGSYFVITGVWPLLHMPSFLTVTGPKTDLWLVETVGVLVATIGAGLIVASVRGNDTREIALVAVLAAIGLATIDVVYVRRGVIDNIYLADAALEALLIGGWVIYAFLPKNPLA
jgi:hypothetical protein